MSTYSAGRYMKSYIDIHSHILPGVDDGAKDIETSMQMLRMAAKDGITEMILTPHNKPGHHSKTSVWMVKTEELRERLVQESIDIKLYTGNELYYRSGLTDEIEDGHAYTLAGSRYVLIEFNPLDDYDYIRNAVNTVLMDGYYPVLAHAERYKNVCTKKYAVTELIDMGCFIQVNAGSIMGKFGFATKQFAKKLLKQHQVHFVATDAHDTGKRAPYLSECAEYVSRKYGRDYSRKLFHDNSEYILQDKEI